LAALVVYLRVFSGHVVQSASNSKGNLKAEVINDSGTAAATDVGYLGVTLKTWFNPIRHYVFGGSNYGADIQIKWINDHTLLIHCDHCEKLDGGNILERRWHQVIICYDRSNATDLQENQDSSCPRRVAPAISEPHS
jgi:hypothetical protein